MAVSKPERYHTTDDAAGTWDLRPCLRVYRSLPIAGKSLLDVGCRDGWHATLFESIGAMVTCLDIYDSPYRPHSLAFIAKDIFDLPTFRQWDVVFSGDVIQHVDNPLGFLRRLKDLTAATLYLATDVHVELGDRCVVHKAMGSYKSEASYPFLWGEGFVTDLITMAGFSNPRRLAHWLLPSNKPEYQAILPEGRSVMLFAADV